MGCRRAGMVPTGRLMRMMMNKGLAKRVAGIGAAAVVGALVMGVTPAGFAEGATGSLEDAPEAKAERAGGSAAAVKALREIVARQRAALAKAAEKETAAEAEDARPELQRVVDGYEALVTAHPDFAAGWAAYGLFLCEPVVEERKAALRLLLKANGLDGGLAVVKNQIGVLMAEEGRVVDAFNYFLAASDLEPEVALYHFQIGLLLDEGREVFLKTRAWKPAAIDKSVLAAFRRAVELAPERMDYAYRAAEAYEGLAEPRWEEAYAAWSALEGKLKGEIEKQAVRLQMARAQWRQGQAALAREIAGTVDEPVLQGQKAKLLAEFAAEDAAEAAAGAGK